MFLEITIDFSRMKIHQKIILYFCEENRSFKLQMTCLRQYVGILSRLRLKLRLFLVRCRGDEKRITNHENSTQDLKAAREYRYTQCSKDKQSFDWTVTKAHSRKQRYELAGMISDQRYPIVRPWPRQSAKRGRSFGTGFRLLAWRDRGICSFPVVAIALAEGFVVCFQSYSMRS